MKIGLRVFDVLLCAVLLASVNGCGGSSPSPVPPTKNLAPGLSSISPSVLAVGGPDTNITLTGSNFVSASVVTIGASTVLSTHFISSTQLSATIPASVLASMATLQMTVNNPSPGGGVSPSQTLTVVQVGSVVLLATPSVVGQATGPWQLAVSAVDPNGDGIPNLPISLQSTLGTLSASTGFTDSSGGLTAMLTPPGNVTSSAAAVITATTGAQTALVDIVFADIASPATLQQSRIQPASTPSTIQTTRSPFSIGVANASGATNMFANTSVLQSDCTTDAALSTTVTSACQNVLSQNNIRLSAPSIINASCKVVGVTATVVSLADCGVTVSTVLSCIFSETGIGGIICAATAEFTATDAGPGCIEFLAQQIANQFGTNSITAGTLEGVGLILDPTDPVNLASSFCTAAQTLFPLGPLIFVANYSANTITVMDQSGNVIPRAGGFPNLSGPDGLAYDPDNGLLYVGNSGNNTITAYDPKTGSQVFTSGSFPNPCIGYDITYEGFSHQLYVNDAFCNSMIVYTPDGNVVILPSGSFPGIVRPYGMTWNPLNDELLITDGQDNEVFVCTSSGGSCVASSGFSGLSVPDDLVTTPDGNIYVPNEGSGTVNEYTSNGTLIRTITLSSFSSAHAVAFQGTNVSSYQVYITDSYQNVVWVFDGNGTFVNKLGGPLVLNNPTGIAVIP